MKYHRILLKISGEMLAGRDGHGMEAAALLSLARDIADLRKKKIEVAIVMGGGNFWRYRANKHLSISRPTSDAVGMMATLMNARLLQEALSGLKIACCVVSPHGEGYFAEPYSPRRGQQCLAEQGVVLCAGGTGNPYFTTDTAAVLRALELDCEVVFKLTQVNGVYDKDPLKYKGARFFPTISYDELLKRELQIIDLTAITLCKENKLPVLVFQGKVGNVLRAASGKKLGTVIS